ncbi:hypothetical protein B0T25DRAFT_137924 [Lasiosphaeria hispida]|uniref:Uncharacterized protein n=1 Tax=Lasiosphaeria hispida TaxID=260671 RepID=A0AAJ0HKR8_9PEZI|nr:hypothetical protein B0T25DRAFT_137924 [Lasiosphaeria hispida]
MATFANTQSNYDLAAAAFAAFNSTAFNTLTTQTRPPHRHAAPNQRADRVSKSTSTTRFPPQPNRHQHRAQHLPTPGPDHPSNTSAASPILPCATFGSPLRRSTGARINSQPHSQIPKKRPLASDMARTSKKPHIGPTSLWPDTTSSSPLRSIPPRPSPPPGMSNHTLPTSPTTAPIGTLFPLASAGTNHTSPPRVAATCPTSNGGDSAVNVDKPVGRPVAKAVEQVRATQEEHRRLSVPRDSGVRDVWSTEEEDNDDDWADFNAKEESSDNGEQVVEPTDSEPTEEIGGDLSVGHGGTPTGKESETIVASIEHADTSAEGDRDVGGAQSDGVMDEQDGGEATATHQKTDSGEAQSGASDIAEKQNREQCGTGGTKEA